MHCTARHCTSSSILVVPKHLCRPWPRVTQRHSVTQLRHTLSQIATQRHTASHIVENWFFKNIIFLFLNQCSYILRWNISQRYTKNFVTLCDAVWRCVTLGVTVGVTLCDTWSQKRRELICWDKPTHSVTPRVTQRHGLFRSVTKRHTVSHSVTHSWSLIF